MSSILYGLAAVPIAGLFLLLIYDRFFSPRGITLQKDRREREERGAQARLDLLGKTPD